MRDSIKLLTKNKKCGKTTSKLVCMRTIPLSMSQQSTAHLKSCLGEQVYCPSTLLVRVNVKMSYQSRSYLNGVHLKRYFPPLPSTQSDNKPIDLEDANFQEDSAAHMNSAHLC